MTYTGIGSRQTPPDVINLMIRIGSYMARKGWILRSGGANGADAAFEQGCNEAEGPCEVYLPWKGFNGNISNLDLASIKTNVLAAQAAEKIWTMRFKDGNVPTSWDRLKEQTRFFMTRNVFQISGQDLQSNSDLVIYWTPNGDLVGGTAQALYMAKMFGIPCIYLGRGLKTSNAEKVAKILDLDENPEKLKELSQW